MRAFLLGLLVSFGATALNSAPVTGVFQSIDGGTLDLSSYRGGRFWWSIPPRYAGSPDNTMTCRSFTILIGIRV